VSAFAGLQSAAWLPTHHYFLGSELRHSPLEATAAAAAVRPPKGSIDVHDLVARAAQAFDVATITRKLRELTLFAVRTIEAEKAELVLATSGDPIFLVAAAKAAQATGRPLYVHLFDLFAGNQYSLPKRVLASRTERAILRQARYVFVPNNAMATHYQSRLGIVPIVVPNGTNIPTFSAARPASMPATILYTGAIYWAQRDAVRNLATALRRLPGVTFQVKTSASPLTRVRVGLRQQHVSAGFGDQEGALQAQRSADLLFLPLTFRTAGRDVIRTALPAKTAEYLVSGTPILVHAPPDAYISQYARSAKWAYVVDASDPKELIVAVKTLLNDLPLRAALVASAYGEAVRAHDLLKIRAEYATYFA